MGRIKVLHPGASQSRKLAFTFLKMGGGGLALSLR